MSIKAERHGSILTLTLDRPEKAHAYTQSMLQGIDTCLDTQEISVLVIQSTGNRAFCAGADLDEMKAASPQDASQLLSQAVFERIARHEAVSIAAVQGPAVAGGFELALACDLRIAGPLASFSLPEVSLGLIPSAGGCTRLPELVGQARARQIILGGEVLSAEMGHSWGLVSRLEDQPRTAAHELAKTIAGYDRRALKMAKAVLRGDLSDRLELERLAQTVLYAHRNQSKSD